MLFTDQKPFIDKVISSSWWRCLSTSFVKGYPQFTFKFHVMSGSWKTRRNFFFPVWNLLNKLWVVVISTSWKFGMYFVYFFNVNWNFLTKFCSSDLSVKEIVWHSILKIWNISACAATQLLVFTYYMKVSPHSVSWKHTWKIALDKWHAVSFFKCQSFHQV